MKTTSSFNDPEFTKQAKLARSRRLAKALTDLIDLKVKGIITEQEYRQRKRNLLGFLSPHRCKGIDILNIISSNGATLIRLDTYSPGGEFRLSTNNGQSVLAHVFTTTKPAPDDIKLPEVEFVISQPDLVQNADMLSFMVIEADHSAAVLVGWDWTDNILQYAAHDERDEDKLIIPAAKLKGDMEFGSTFKKND